MAFNKNFVVKNGFEVNNNLIYADADLNRVGVGSTGPRIELDVRGGIAATSITISGVSTVVNTFHVGTGGQVFTVLGIGGSVGVGTNRPEYLFDVRSPVSTGQTTLYVKGDGRFTGNVNIEGDLFVDDITFDQAELNYLNVTGFGTVSSLFVPNIASIKTGIVTFIEGTNLNYSGFGTFGTLLATSTQLSNLNVSGVTSISSLFVTDSTVETLSVNQYSNLLGITTIINATGSNLNFSGVGTVTTLTGTSFQPTNLNVSGVGTITTVKSTSVESTNINLSGVGTVTTLTGTSFQPTNLNVSGVSTLGTVTISSGIVTASSGIVTYYGDGAYLINLPSASPAGSDTQVQYNNGGSFAGSFNLTHDGTTTRILSGIVTTISGTNLNYTGVGTVTTVKSTSVQSTNLNTTGVGTVTTVKSTSVQSTNLNTTGVGTVTTLTGTSFQPTNLNVSGVGTITTVKSTSVESTNINVTGVVTATSASVGSGVTINSTGINVTGVVTATSFIGDGSGLTGAGAILNDDTSTNATYYPVFSSATSGSLTTANVSSTKLTYNPSTGEATAVNFNSTSDANLKTNIQTVQNALDIVDNLRGVSFEWKESGLPSYGVIAQELQEVLPELVRSGDYKSVNYNGIVGVLIEAIKELADEVQQLKSEIDK